jgi:hypothetical protein
VLPLLESSEAVLLSQRVHLFSQKASPSKSRRRENDWNYRSLFPKNGTIFSFQKKIKNSNLYIFNAYNFKRIVVAIIFVLLTQNRIITNGQSKRKSF